MKIKREWLQTLWYEDENGRRLPAEANIPHVSQEASYRVSCLPLELHRRKVKLTESFAEQGIDEMICLGDVAEKTIMGMVNSGRYSLSEALLICAEACERCSNVLAYKYTKGREGYEEFSEEWQMCHTVCEFCKKDKIII